MIGGAELYRLALPAARRAVVTELALDVDGDSYAPQLGPDWRETSREPLTSASGVQGAFVTYERPSGTA